MIKQRPLSCQANDKPHQEMILVGFKAKLMSAAKAVLTLELQAERAP